MMKKKPQPKKAVGKRFQRNASTIFLKKPTSIRRFDFRLIQMNIPKASKLPLTDSIYTNYNPYNFNDDIMTNGIRKWTFQQL